jgi:quercetin dioxygenase-like cupin family protein
MKSARKTKNKFAKAIPITLAEAVKYCKESIVSRTLVNNKSGTITFFAFDKNQGLSEHSAPFDAVVQIIDGAAQIKIGKKSLKVCKGQFVVMPQNIPHALKATSRFKMVLTMIR